MKILAILFLFNLILTFVIIIYDVYHIYMQQKVINTLFKELGINYQLKFKEVLK